MKKFLVTLSLVWMVSAGFAQQIRRFNPDTLITYIADPISVTSSRITNETFIKLILRDTSFYQAFSNMKKFSFTAENRVYTYTKKNKVEGKIYRKIYHNNNGKYKMELLAKQDSGKLFKKNGKYELETVKMFDYIFSNPYNSGFVSSPASSADESYKDKLKTLIFRPGQPIKGMVFALSGLGSKTQIFSANMRQYYNYAFYSGTYLDSIPVYRFKVSMKPGLSNWTKDGIMIKELTTIFDKRNMQILGRYIDMKLDATMLYDFDVQMNIELGYFDKNSTLLPTKISYQGNWDYIMHKQERASFLILHKGYTRGKK
ncbi:MAG TPA: hypothetical protein DIT07_03775 [Sphingobacteriaceae bacterium]|nr:hypothetical protein [Sphingobacteriaceae bacterium]